MKCIGLFTLAVSITLLFVGHAARIEIDTQGDPDSRLEIRNVTLPDGTEVELYIIRAKPVIVTIDEQELIAEHIEFDLTNRLIRIVGFGTFTTESETVQGNNLVIELEEETFSGTDVLIVTEAIDVFGVEASRAPGRISVASGAFSPCSRCNQSVHDFGFEAKRLELFPGDRLVAFDVTLLIRGVEVLPIPALVIPLGPPDRRPRLSISQGTEDERAEVELDWPYVAGANALGTFSVRYFADVTPGGGGTIFDRLLGGQVDTSYLGGAVAHRFFTPQGSGHLDLEFVPGFLDESDERTDEEFTARFAFTTEPSLDIPQIDLLVERDDGNRQELIEYNLLLENAAGRIQTRYQTQGFVDLNPKDDVDDPSFQSATTPRRTLSLLELQPTGETSLTAGPFTVRDLRLELGIFEDASNPTNRSAALSPLTTEGRLLEQHTLLLTPTPLWSGFSLSGETAFTGRYYTTAERLIDWDTSLRAVQELGSAASFSVTFRRDTNEGETPFRFDQLALSKRTDLTSTLRVTPAPWLSFSADESFVFLDSRRPQFEGLQPLESRLELFQNLSFLDISLSNRYDFPEDDPGTLDAELRLNTSGEIVRSTLEVSHVQDLKATSDRITGQIADDTETSAEFNLSLGRYLSANAGSSYRFAPPLADSADIPREFWRPLELDLTVGTTDQGDLLPSLNVGFERDLNLGRLEELSLEATGRLGPVELSASQSFDFVEEATEDNPDGAIVSRPGNSRVRANWPGAVGLEAEGFTLIRPEWLGLTAGDETSQTFTVSLRDTPRERDEAWRLRYRTTRNPVENDSGQIIDFTNSNTSIEAQVQLQEVVLSNARFTVNLFADIRLPDEDTEAPGALVAWFVRRSDLQILADLYGRVGIQGNLRYQETIVADPFEITRAALTIDDFTVTVRPVGDLFVGATFDDVWDFTGNTPSATPYNFQPNIFVAWDRCCWALIGSWDTETGQLKIALTTPGGTEGFEQAFDTGIVLPGRVSDE